MVWTPKGCARLTERSRPDWAPSDAKGLAAWRQRRPRACLVRPSGAASANWKADQPLDPERNRQVRADASPHSKRTRSLRPSWTHWCGRWPGRCQQVAAAELEERPDVSNGVADEGSRGQSYRRREFA